MIIQPIYFFMTIVSLILAGFSFKKDKLMLSKWAFEIMIYRNFLRLYDFENTAKDDDVFIGT